MGTEVGQASWAEVGQAGRDGSGQGQMRVRPR
jgi:hypothetical protein